MTKFISVLLFTLSAISLSASDVLSSYIAVDKLNKSVYSTQNEDIILGLGINIKSSEKLSFTIAYEGDIYNETTNSSILNNPTYKVISYIDDGALTYKINYKF